MKFKRLLKLIFACISVLILIWFVIYYFVTTISFIDYPRKLSHKTETIDIIPVDWACDCADWIETSYFDKNQNYEIREEDCIFIESADKKLDLPIDAWNQDSVKYVLRLKGQFYEDKGISRTYSQSTPEKPEKSRVFRFHKHEFVIVPNHHNF